MWETFGSLSRTAPLSSIEELEVLERRLRRTRRETLLAGICW